MKRAVIKIKNLSLRTIIGLNDWERDKKQNVIINAAIEFDATEAIETDTINNSLNYKSIIKKIISEVEDSSFHLLEKLADFILNSIMEDKKVLSATVEVDKPHSLRFAESVSVVVSGHRDNPPGQTNKV